MDIKEDNINEDNSASNEPLLQEQETDLKDPELPAQKKGGGKLAGFSFLLALLAFLTAGWIFYHVEMNSDDTHTVNQLVSKASQQDLNQLEKRLSQQEQELSKLNRTINQTQQQFTQLQQDINNRSDNQFDDGPLKQRIKTLEQQLTALKNQTPQQVSEPQTDEYLSALARAQTVNALKTVQLLLSQQQLPQAVEILKQWRNNENLPLAVQTRLQQLITTLSNTETPNNIKLKSQLTALRDSIEALSLTTETQQSQQPAWYERFITVKKIKPEQHNLNSIDLLQLKANANHAVQQAELALSLKQPTLWQQSLQQAEHVLAQSQLNTDPIQQQLQQLTEQKITTQIPNNLGIEALIRQLEGIAE